MPLQDDRRQRVLLQRLALAAEVLCKREEGRNDSRHVHRRQQPPEALLPARCLLGGLPPGLEVLMSPLPSGLFFVALSLQPLAPGSSLGNPLPLIIHKGLAALRARVGIHCENLLLVLRQQVPGRQRQRILLPDGLHLAQLRRALLVHGLRPPPFVRRHTVFQRLPLREAGAQCSQLPHHLPARGAVLVEQLHRQRRQLQHPVLVARALAGEQRELLSFVGWPGGAHRIVVR
mmetsp:Transcript_16454/g.42165  ORF Transcript_16454/g.42165 Transcript_16454/m.42165 type:complete len:232 (-) Transcript_16454:481-1176(-)